MSSPPSYARVLYGLQDLLVHRSDPAPDLLVGLRVSGRQVLSEQRGTMRKPGKHDLTRNVILGPIDLRHLPSPPLLLTGAVNIPPRLTKQQAPRHTIAAEPR